MSGQGSRSSRVVRKSGGASPLSALARLVYVLMSIVMLILAFRFVLRLFGANPGAAFVDLVYRISAPLVAPFETVFPATALDQAVFEWNSLLAIAVYAVISWAVTAVLMSVGSGSRTEVVEEVDTRRTDDV